MILVEVDGNFIDAEPMKNNSEGSMIKAYQALWARLTASGTVKPKTPILDNEASTEFKKEIRKNCTIQLVPPNNHRRNLAERAIQTFKSHFKAVLAGVDETIPMRLWDRLLPQTILTLNLLRQSNAVPTVSAWQYVNGNFDYNRMPLTPMGCAAQLHQSNEIRTTWAMKAIDGWYLQSLAEHYRCHVIYVKQTKSKRISDTVFFKTKYLTQPTLSLADVISKALIDLTQALKGNSNQKGIDQIEALKRLGTILNNKPEIIPTPMDTSPIQRRGTFDEAAKAPIETESRETTATPRANKQPQQMQTEPIHAAAIEKTISKRPTPRVPSKTSTKEITPGRIETRERIRKYLESKTMAQIPHRSTHLRRTTKRAQLIHDKETDTYLNYPQLVKHPKYKETWSKSAAMSLDD
jgi:hypothetical protein